MTRSTPNTVLKHRFRSIQFAALKSSRTVRRCNLYSKHLIALVNEYMWAKDVLWFKVESVHEGRGAEKFAIKHNSSAFVPNSTTNVFDMQHKHACKLSPPFAYKLTSISWPNGCKCLINSWSADACRICNSNIKINHDRRVTTRVRQAQQVCRGFIQNSLRPPIPFSSVI